MAQVMMRSDEASDYWDSRHGKFGELRSGGDIGLSEHDNVAFYLRRLGMLLSVVGDYSSRHLPMRVLDAGCGKGFFSEHLVACGHEVVGFDPSPNALRHLRESGSKARYVQSSIVDFSSPELFDVVYSIDVLFHILDDEEWEASVRSLASLCRFTGVLALTDYEGERRVELGDYIVHRASSEYEAVLQPLGFGRVDTIPYQFRNNPNAFHVYASAR